MCGSSVTTTHTYCTVKQLIKTPSCAQATGGSKRESVRLAIRSHALLTPEHGVNSACATELTTAFVCLPGSRVPERAVKIGAPSIQPTGAVRGTGACLLTMTIRALR